MKTGWGLGLRAAPIAGWALATWLWWGCPCSARQVAPPATVPDTGGATNSKKDAPAGAPPGKPAADSGAKQPSSGQTPPSQQPKSGRDLLDLDISDLSNVQVTPQPARSQPAPAAQTQPRDNPSGPGEVLTPTPGNVATPTSVGGLLNQASSVSTRRTSALNLDPIVRGFQSSQINASANGMTQLKTRIDIDSLYSQIDPGIVESLSVIDGPYTSLYGPGFAFLTADLLKAPRYAGGTEYHGALNFSYDNNGRQITDRERLWGGGPDWGVVVSYGLRTGGEYSPGHDSPDFRVPAQYRQQDVFFAGSVDLTNWLRLDMNYVRQNLYDVELPGVAYDLRRSATDQYNVRLAWQEAPNEPDRALLQFWSEHTVYDGNASRPSKRITFSNVLLGEADPFLLGGNLINDGLSESKGLRGIVNYGNPDCFLLTVGADWRRYRIQYHERDFNGDGTPAFQGQVFGIPRSSMEDVGLLANSVTPLSKEVKVTVGGRADWTKPYVDPQDEIYTVSNSIPGNIILAGQEEPRDFLGMLYGTAEYRPQEWLRFTGGVAFGMRQANVSELYNDEPFQPIIRFGNSFSDGNSALLPEKNLQFDLGVNGGGTWGSLGARVFHSTIYDYILPVPSNLTGLFVQNGTPAPMLLHRNYTAFLPVPPDPNINVLADTSSLDYRYSNVHDAILYGGEMMGEIHLQPWLDLRGNLAYVHGSYGSVVRYDGTTNGLVFVKSREPLPNIYPLNSTLTLRFHDPCHDRWSLEWVTRMVASQHRVAATLAELPTPGFMVYGIRGTYKVNEHLSLLSSIDNLFDRSYYEHGSLAIAQPGGTVGFVREPGFSWIIGLEARF